MAENELKGTRIPVLDKGWVELQDWMGDDLAIVNAARVSFLGESKGDERDKKLLFYLMQHRHTTPFEMVEFKFRVKCPIIVARQWMRHRVFSFNEVSRRYTSEAIEFYIPSVWRTQSSDNKQASAGELDQEAAHKLTAALESYSQQALALYHEALEAGVAREMARLFLPHNLYTEFIAKIDAHNLMHFLRLRMAPDAQYEIRQYAWAIYEHLFKPALPWTAEAFEKFVLPELGPIKNEQG
ncbi:MAG TPA: FAD-dependent thymidylate synthase [Aggregatilineaceae bacterium]|nr:FAD-dependent thymidylate synthase [Aggregatilineaceae bacterium]